MADELIKEKKERRFTLSYNAPVTLTFALISLVVLGLGKITGDHSTHLLFSVYRSKISFFGVLRLFGHVLGHANIQHYTGNMMLILLLGPVLEKRYGGKNLIEAICITAVISGLVSVIFFPNAALLGASGIVFMMIVLVSAGDLRHGVIPITLILVLLMYLGTEIWTMITVKDNISQLTHIVGGVCGAAFGVILMNEKKTEE